MSCMKMDVEIKSNILDYYSILKNEIDNALIMSANELRNEMVLNKLSGNPVRRRTGNLANSIAVKKVSDGVEVGSYGVRYAKYLEYSDKFKKYRWLRPSLSDARERMLQVFKQVLGKRIKR